jgi:hypothetical protein
VPAQGDLSGQSRQLESIGPPACFDLHVPQNLDRVQGTGLEGACVWSRVHAQYRDTVGVKGGLIT